MKSRKSTGAAVLAAFAALCASHAEADTITIVGTEFDVIYDPTQLGLFNTPVLVGDNLFFTPTNFIAQSVNGQGTVSTPSIASIQLVAHAGFQFTTVGVAAIGDYTMTGGGSSVGFSGSLTASDPSRPLTLTTAAMVANSGMPLTLIDGQFHNWSASTTINGSTPTDTPGNNPWMPSASSIDLILSNTLSATTTMGVGQQSAFIQEKFSGIELMIDPVAVPLPAGIILLGSGLIGLATRRRRKA